MKFRVRSLHECPERVACVFDDNNIHNNFEMKFHSKYHFNWLTEVQSPHNHTHTPSQIIILLKLASCSHQRNGLTGLNKVKMVVMTSITLSLFTTSLSLHQAINNSLPEKIIWN